MLRRLILPPTHATDPRRAGLRYVNFAWLCVLAGVGLSLMGLDAIDIGERLAPTSGDPIGPIQQKQTIFLAVGLVAAGIIALPSYRYLAVLAWPAYAGRHRPPRVSAAPVCAGVDREAAKWSARLD